MFRYVLKKLIKQKSVFLFIVMIFASFIVSAISPYLNGAFIDFLTYDAEVNNVIKFAIIIAVIGVAGALISYLANILTVNLLNKTIFSLLFNLVDELEHTILIIAEKFQASYITQRIFADVNTVTSFVVSNFLTAILNAILIVGTIILFATINPLLFILIIICITAYILLFLKLRKPLYKTTLEKKEADSRIFGKINAQIEQIFNTQLNSSYEQSNSILNTSFLLYLPKVIKSGRISYLFSSADNIISVIFQSIMFIFAGFQIAEGKMTIGEFIMINSYFALLLKCVKYFTGIYKQYQDAQASFSRILELQNNPKVHCGTEQIEKISNIELKNLSFAFDTINAKLPVLEKIDYTFSLGNTYSIIGENGSGKSTLLKLLTDLYESNDSVFLNGRESKKIDMNLVRKNLISIVPQNLCIPDETVKGFLLSTLQISENELMEKLKSKSTILSSYSKGILHLLTSNCKSLSGGELRKIYLWIAVNKRSDVLILDEPTIGLDSNSQADLIDFIEQNDLNQMIIVMTHDQHIVSATQHILKLESRM